MAAPSEGSNAQKAIVALEEEGWFAVADDVREGLSGQTICERLRDIGEGDSTAYSIVSYYLCS